MIIGFFGHYDRNYSRNRIIIRGLRQNGVRVVHCNDFGLLPVRYLKLLFKILGLISKINLIFVGFPGHTDVLLACVVGKFFKKKVFFDPFVSVYDTNIFDRRYFPKNSLRAFYYFWVDWLATRLPDRIVFDTRAHQQYFVRTFSLSENKSMVLPVGTDERVFRPQKQPENKRFVVGFHGSFLPLQGITCILRAAKLLFSLDIEFRLLGDGMEYSKCRELASKLKLKNVKFLPRVPYEQLPRFIAGADIYLGGPFGTTPKGQRVIPNKIYEALAMEKPVIVGDTPAVREMYEHLKNAFFVKVGSASAIAAAIIELKKDNLLRRRIALGGRRLFLEKLTPEVIGRQLKVYLLDNVKTN